MYFTFLISFETCYIYILKSPMWWVATIADSTDLYSLDFISCCKAERVGGSQRKNQSGFLDIREDILG